MIEKRKALTAKQNKPALPGDVSGAYPRKAGCIRKSQQASQTATA